MEWGNEERTEAIRIALAFIPHTQSAVGLGFKLIHNPQRCFKCRAEISLGEIQIELMKEVAQ